MHQYLNELQDLQSECLASLHLYEHILPKLILNHILAKLVLDSLLILGQIISISSETEENRENNNNDEDDFYIALNISFSPQDSQVPILLPVNTKLERNISKDQAWL
jgi:hypothetical protein